MEKSEVGISSVVLLRNQDKTDTQIIQNLVKCQEYTELILVSNDLEFVFLDIHPAMKLLHCIVILFLIF